MQSEQAKIGVSDHTELKISITITYKWQESDKSSLPTLFAERNKSSNIYLLSHVE